ncbi:Cilia- and flagella-associated protein 45 [Gonapodya sp. JEL0774]|nr:Cilia- and flagella-associated protein 45 [Gonapodya sp. JEL0774]
MERDEVLRIKTDSIFLTPTEQSKRAAESREHQFALLQAAADRKARMEESERQRTTNKELSDLERETREKNNYLLAKAQMQLDEQEDEIKHMNELMLYAKCVAIRDAQVEEKKTIHQKQKEEQARLDSVMEAERVSDLKRIADNEQKRQQVLKEGADVIRRQIEERREFALLEQERKDQETKATLRAIAERLDDEKRQKVERAKKQKELHRVIARANSESIARKKAVKESALAEDRRVMEYLLEKEKKDAEAEKLKQEQVQAREKDLARLRAMQQKNVDKQAQSDAIRAQRADEAYERDWRRKQKESAEKAAKMEKELREERLKQQKAREHAIAVEAYKLKEEFYENLKRQKEDEEKSQAELQRKQAANRQYSVEVQAQISQREHLKKKAREDFFKEGERLAREREEKRKKLEAIKERKLSELKGLGVPMKYYKEVERKVVF